MANKSKSVSETGSKFIINKDLSMAYLDREDYQRLLEIINILKICDKTVKNTKIVT